MSHRVGQTLCFWILTGNGTVESRSSVQDCSDDEQKSDNILKQLQAFDSKLHEKLGDDVPNAAIESQPVKMLYLWDEEDDFEVPIEPEASQEDEDKISDSTYDQLLATEVYLPQGDKMKSGSKKNSNT